MPRIHRGMALLEPTTISLKGGQTDDLVKNQELMFINTLSHKLAFLVLYHILIIENAIYAVYTLHVAVAIGNQAICIKP